MKGGIARTGLASAHSLGPARLARLDGLRGVAAVGVVLHHIFFYFASWPLAQPPPFHFADWFEHSGWTLVDLFFLLSGYVFAHVYLSGEGPRHWRDFGDFWIARFARLYPLHVVTLVLCAIIMADNPENTARAFLAHLLMLQSFIVTPARSFDGPSWSLSVEVACYMIFVLSCMAGRRVLLIVTAALILWPIWRIATQGDPGGPWIDDMLRRGMLGFFLGQAMWHWRHWLTRIPSPVLIIVMLTGFWLQSGNYSPLLPLSLLAWPAVLLLGLRSAAFEHPVMVWLGDRSYAIYLINFPLILKAASLVHPRAFGTVQVLGWQIGLLVAVLLLSDASYRWLEVPSRGEIRRVRARARARTGLAGPVVG